MTLSHEFLAAERSATVPASTGKATGMRRDTRRNRVRLLAAVNELVGAGADLTMQKVAERADIAIATAYRHFPSVEELIYAYVLAVVEDLSAFSAKAQSQGEQLLVEVLEHWVELITVHGQVMVNHRSPQGFLQRLHAEDPIISTVEAAWREPIAQFMTAKDIDSSAATHAMFLCNQMFDPRDVLDLVHDGGITQAALTRYLLASYEGALRGWASVMS